MIDVNKLEFKTFPGGELHIIDSWIQNGTILQDNSVLCRIQNSDDLIKLCLFTNAFKNFVGRMPHRLVLPYIPYARQDRIASPGEALSIKVFANLLNTLNYKYVYVFDPHSDVCTALIENVKVIPQWEIFADLVPEDADLIAPDAGALKKVYKLQEAVDNNYVEVEDVDITAFLIYKMYLALIMEWDNKKLDEQKGANNIIKIIKSGIERRNLNE